MLKRSGISVADTIIAASARSAGAAVVANDPHFPEMGVEASGYPGLFFTGPRGKKRFPFRIKTRNERGCFRISRVREGAGYS
jgi:hypothetical protein